jgi:S-adenosylmethionine:tRNA ribosyltransferase-isomerase
MLKLSDYNFHLPEELIARYPAEKRDESRLMIVNRKSGTIHIESVFRSIEKHFIKGDLLVFNETRVSEKKSLFKEQVR